MPTESRLLKQMRDAIRPHLPERAFLRRDRGEGLFITNAPVFDPAVDALPGFIAEKEGALLRILPDDSWIGLLESCDPPDHLAASLLRFRRQAVDRANRLLFVQGAKLLDAAGDASPAETEAYDRALRQRSALALRGGCGGALYASAIILAQLQNRKGEKQI